jgi:hypothetical protein
MRGEIVEKTIVLKSKMFKELYGTHPNKYDIKYVHYCLLLGKEYNKEYSLIGEDIKNMYDFLGTTYFKLYFACPNDFLDFLFKVSISKDILSGCYVRVHNTDEYKQLIGKSINAVIFNDDLLKFDTYQLTNDIKVYVQIEDVKDLTFDEINDLIEKGYNIVGVNLLQCPGSTKNPMHIEYLEESAKRLKLKNDNTIDDYYIIEQNICIHNDFFNLDLYKKIIERVRKIVSEVKISNDDSDYDKLKKLYDYIVYNFSYDFDSKDDFPLENQTILGGLFNNKCVCEGYTQVLRLLCNYIGIKTSISYGNGLAESGGHLWNQVFIDGCWYNLDSTADSIYHETNKGLCYFLASDEWVYKNDSLYGHECPNNFNNKKTIIH